MSTKQCSLSTITSNKCFCEGRLGPKPVTIPGKVWVPVWSLQDEAPNIMTSTSSTHSNKSFEDILLDKIKGPKEKPVKKRRKIDLKTKVISDEAYLAEIEHLEKEDQEKQEKKLLRATSKRSKSKKMNDKRKKKDESDDESDEVFEEEENFLSEESEIEVESESDPIETSLIEAWESISPPIPESEILGKWVGVIYETKKKNHLYIGKVLNRFLRDENGPVESLRLDCLKLHVGTDTILEEVPKHLEHDIYNFPASDIITGPLSAIPQKGNKWNFPDYFKIKEKYEKVVK